MKKQFLLVALMLLIVSGFAQTTDTIILTGTDNILYKSFKINITGFDEGTARLTYGSYTVKEPKSTMDLLFGMSGFAQTDYKSEHRLFLEITDTIETAYDVSYGNWIQHGFVITREPIYDSIGVDSVRISRLFYIMSRAQWEKTKYLGAVKYKVYLSYEERKYPNGRKGTDYKLYDF